MQLVLEFCDRGDLRDALEAGVFRLHSRTPTDPSAAILAASPAAAAAAAAAVIPAASVIPAAAATTFGPHPLPASDAAAAAAAEPNPIDYLSVLETAADIARGMAHLHACNIVHLDLKVRGDADRTLYPMPLPLHAATALPRIPYALCRCMPAAAALPRVPYVTLEFLIPVNPQCRLLRFPAPPPPL